jgi:hypothetical protein
MGHTQIEQYTSREIPHDLSDNPAVILLDDERMEISGSSAIYERRLVKKILKPQLPEEGAFRFGTNKSWKIIEIEGRALYPDGREKIISPDEIVVVPDFEDFILYSDQKSHSFRFPGLVPGTIIEVYIKRKIDNLAYWEPAFFQRDIPILTKRYTLIHPDDLDFDAHPSFMSDIPDSTYSLPRGRKKIVWERNDIKPFKPEERMPPGMEYHPALWFFARGEMELGEPLDLESWEGVANWYRNVSNKHLETGSALRSVLDTLLMDRMTERKTAARIFHWVQQNIRYVAIYLGDDGFRPHDTDETISNRYGDCKDMSVVLASALEEAGIESHLVLVRTVDLGRIPGTLPSPRHFNHLIVMSIVEGDTLYLDPTCQTCSFGILPEGDQGAEALVVKEGENRLTILPTNRPRPNIWDISIEATVDSTGKAVMNITVTFDGHFAAAARRALLFRSGRTERETVETMLAVTFPSLRIENMVIRGENSASDALVITAEGMIYDMLDTGKPYSFIKLMNKPLIYGMSDCGDRRYPISLGTPCSLRYEVSLVLPERWHAAATPSSGHIQNDYFDYRFSCMVEGQRVQFSRNWSNEVRIAPADACTEVRNGLEEIIAIEKTSVLAERK